MYVYLHRRTWDGWNEIAQVPRRDYENPTTQALIDDGWHEVTFNEFLAYREGIWPGEPVEESEHE